jgi:hypothetical protein
MLSDVGCNAIRKAATLPRLCDMLMRAVEDPDAGRGAATTDGGALGGQDMGREGGVEGDDAAPKGAKLSTWQRQRELMRQLPPDRAQEAQAMQFWALSTLRNLASSNVTNRQEIHKLNVIPLLVDITTAAGDASGSDDQQGGRGPKTTDLSQQAAQANVKAAQAEEKAFQLEKRAAKARVVVQGQLAAARLAGHTKPQASRQASQRLEAALGAANAARDEAKALREEARAKMLAAREAIVRKAELTASGYAASAASAEGGASAVVADTESAKMSKLLATLAGEVLNCLLVKGEKAIEEAIVSGIVDAVSNEGALPPIGFTGLMEVLQTAALERLQAASLGEDEAAMEAAFEFGRWIRLPTRVLGNSRNVFKRSSQEAMKEHKALEHRKTLGLVRMDGSRLARQDRSPARRRIESGATEQLEGSDDQKAKATALRSVIERQGSVSHRSRPASASLGAISTAGAGGTGSHADAAPRGAPRLLLTPAKLELAARPQSSFRPPSSQGSHRQVSSRISSRRSSARPSYRGLPQDTSTRNARSAAARRRAAA